MGADTRGGQGLRPSGRLSWSRKGAGPIRTG